MIAVNIRKQGGAAIITIPADLLKVLDVGVGSMLKLSQTKEGFMAEPLSRKQRYKLSELLQGATPTNLKTLHKNTAWAREGESTGRELT